jgi:hypothetical protein
MRPVEYSHRQIGKIQIWASIIAIVIILLATVFAPEIRFILAVVILVLGAALLLFSTLTVEITSGAIQVSFGPIHLIRKAVPVDQITGIAKVKNRWIYGWGVRKVPNGTMYNISGFDTVEIGLSTGKRFLIGTDEPDRLISALEKATGLEMSAPE